MFLTLKAILKDVEEINVNDEVSQLVILYPSMTLLFT